MTKAQKAKVAKARVYFETWKTLFETRAEQSQALRKAAAAYGALANVSPDPDVGFGRRRKILEAEVALLAVAQQYASTITKMSLLNASNTSKPPKKKDTYAGRT